MPPFRHFDVNATRLQQLPTVVRTRRKQKALVFAQAVGAEQHSRPIDRVRPRVTTERERRGWTRSEDEWRRV